MTFTTHTSRTSGAANHLQRLGFSNIAFDGKSAFIREFGKARLLIELHDEPKVGGSTRVDLATSFGFDRVPFSADDEIYLDYTPPRSIIPSILSSSTSFDKEAIARISYLHDIGMDAASALVGAFETKDHLILSEGTYCAFLDKYVDFSQLIQRLPEISANLDLFASSSEVVAAILENLEAYRLIAPVANSLLSSNNRYGLLLNRHCDTTLEQISELIMPYASEFIGFVSDLAVIDR